MKLKTKLITLNFFMLFFVGSMLFLQFRAAQNKQKFEIRKGFSQASLKLEKAISNVFYLYYHNVQNIALNGSLQKKSFDEANFYFNELVSLYPLYDLIVFVDMDGKYVASNSLDSAGKKLSVDNVKSYDFSSETWFKSVKEGKLVEDYDKKIYGSFFGEFERSGLAKAAYGTQRSGNHFSTQVNDEFGDAVGFITTFVNSKWIDAEVTSLNNSLKMEGKKGAQLFVLNAEGKVISELTDDKIITDNILKVNGVDKYKELITESKNLVEPSFINSMFLIDNKELSAYTEFDYEKFIKAIGWKSFIKMSSGEAFSSISVATNIFTLSFIFTLILASLLSMLVSNKLSTQLLGIASSIGSESGAITEASGQLSEHSSSLSSATSEQASNLQETVASLNEISAMINKNTEASQSSKDLSIKSRKAAELGKGTIDKMLTSIDDISDANTDIIDQMKQNTEEIKDIITVIKEIEDKTKVINDIVFQTKLLSFNASVEAARAGEHGKGFSVVAEEVGNLAQHSGDAAKQIEEMLNESVNKVEAIANNTETKVKVLIEQGTARVETGKSVARECDTALGEILECANTLDGMIDEIAVASIEQSQGVQEINKAMSELDSVTKQNSLIAHETSLNTKGLNKQAVNLNEISKSLTDLITGEKNSDLSSIVLSAKEDKRFEFVEEEEEETDDYSSRKAHQEVGQDEEEVVEEREEVQEVEKKPKPKKVINSESKKIASSDISVPAAEDGDWEDI
jgi:methyl-accepting chemotaxis protein